MPPHGSHGGGHGGYRHGGGGWRRGWGFNDWGYPAYPYVGVDYDRVYVVQQPSTRVIQRPTTTAMTGAAAPSTLTSNEKIGIAVGASLGGAALLAVIIVLAIMASRR